MKKRLQWGVIGFTLPFILIACNKMQSPPEDVVPPDSLPETPASIPVPGVLDYGDSIIYAQWSPGKDQVISPREVPFNGKYISWPQGLVMDETTGRINISLSPHGLSFTIGFINLSINDTTLIQLTISGVNYHSGIYILENNDTLAIPHYNETISLLSLLGISDDNDYPDNPNGNGGGDDEAEFDDGHDDDNGNGYADEPPLGQRANDQMVRVRTTNGVINLKKSLLDGAFGTNPQSGTTKEITIYYRLNDLSNWALQNIPVKLYFYEYEGDIPQELLSTVRQQMNDDQARAAGRTTEYDSKPRPPQIIVTRYAGESSSDFRQ